MSAPLLLERDLARGLGKLGLAGRVNARLTRIWKAGERIVLTAEVPINVMDAGGLALLGLQSNLLGHYFKLERAERSLSQRTRRRKRSPGSTAIRQVELERQRLGRELHTGVGQLLAAIRMQMELIEAQLPDPPAGVQEALGRVSLLAEDALDQVRNVSKSLHPPDWQRLTISDAIRQLYCNSGIPNGFEATLDVRPLAREPELEIKTVLYRTAQEAFSNLARHAQATSVTIVLEPWKSQVVLTIRDNGVGFDVTALFAAPASLTEGIGLRSLRDQASAVGGKLEIESSPAGTMLKISAPYAPADV